ncbi:YolD-like family protein [Chengkuizengella axinellae]|uniref:YolD-like family protein n=1 Tax=Chengkuizengella axinellae TaxID=3064388 RepID=A0ABT9IWB4_9BACL|nr:YolD-like family protein [Chengkuizengella sp. 2205SS18-9]MDP5273392.1 YolD-like family protein [Chengkuizengella sp. 2205SS18-9]
MSKKLEGNGLWESSRMMLPEHKERINLYHEQRKKKSKPQLIEEEIWIISQRLSDSMLDVEEVTIELFNENGHNHFVTGIVNKMDTTSRQIKLQLHDNHNEWIQFDDIIDAK